MMSYRTGWNVRLLTVGRASFRCCLALLLWVSAASSVTRQSCQLTFTGCPETFDGDTIDVPLDVVGLTGTIRHCPPEVVIRSHAEKPPTVVFVIDNTGTMGSIDPEFARFEVPLRLMEEIYEVEPNTLVSVAIFCNRLMWDHRDDSLFRQMASIGIGHDSYFPPTPLNHVYPDGKNTVEKLRELMDYSGRSDRPWYWLANQTQQPNDRTIYDGTTGAQGFHGTDVTLGFDAARDALRGIDSISPPEQQFIVMLSDGEPHFVDLERVSRANAFVDGDSVPTTFTVFFGSSAPTRFVTMTENIRNNGYSANNPKSNLWSINTPHDELLGLLESQVLTTILAGTASPTRGVVSGVASVASSDSTFTFSKPFPLGAASTDFEFDFRYQFVDTTNGGMTVRDTTVGARMHFRRVAGARLPAGIETVCSSRSLDVRQNGTVVTRVGKDGSVEVAMAFVNSQPPADTLTVELSLAQSGDRLVLPLTLVNGVFTGSVAQQLGPADVQDGVLQHDGSDTLRVLWRHPDLPIDKLVVELPVVNAETPALSAEYRDTNADGLVDQIALALGDAALNVANVAAHPDRIQLFSGVLLDTVVLSPARDTLYLGVTQSAPGFINGDRSITIASSIDLPGDGYLAPGTIAVADAVAPVLVSAMYRIERTADAGRTGVLTVTFSEATVVDSSVGTMRPFLVEGRTATYSFACVNAVASDGGTTVRFDVVSVTDGVLPAPGDSVWLNPAEPVMDNSGNAQTNRLNVRRPLEVVAPPVEFAVSAMTPFNPLRDPLPVPIPESGIARGTVVMVAPSVPVDSVLIPVSSAAMTVYDVVGNVVASGLPGYFRGANILIPWDGRNAAGRTVGTGTYLCVVSVNRTDGATETRRTRLGVER